MLGITDRDYHHQLTSNPQDVCEDVIRYFFSIPNGINPLLNAFPAKFPDGSWLSHGSPQLQRDSNTAKS